MALRTIARMTCPFRYHSIALVSSAMCAVLLAMPLMADKHDQDSESNNTRFPESGLTGSLVINGGGGVPENAREAFIELAGGVDDARLVAIPTASTRADEDDAEKRFTSPWRERGITAIHMLHTRDRDTSNDESFVEPIRNATGVWISGGAQARLAAAYHDTRVHEELLALLERGGVIGGSSAGAAIMSDPMIERGNPEPDMSAGLGFLPGVIVDQHARERNRLPRLRNALERTPQYFGLAIDERTAIIVQGREARVVGEAAVTKILPAGTDHDRRERQLEDGMVIDLAELSREAVLRSGEPCPATD